MFKKMIVFVMTILALSTYSLAANNFSIITESDSKDYIGGGKGRNFNTTNKDKITVINSDTKNLVLGVESFKLGTPINFSFGIEDNKTFQKGLYDPAKRYPFRGSYNGIDISGDGRGCNAIIGKFYVHEYIIGSNGIVNKAAIDFVQYCEGGSDGLYGSIRYNSAIVSSCSKAGSCDGVKKKLGIPTIQNNQSQTTTSTETIDKESLKKLYKRHYKTFSLFMRGEYRMTYRRDFKNINKYCKINNLFDVNPNSNNFFTNNVCGINYNSPIEDFNSGFRDSTDDGESSGDSTLVPEDIKELRSMVKGFVTMKKSSKLTIQEDISLSIVILGLIRADYLIHDKLFSSK